MLSSFSRPDSVKQTPDDKPCRAPCQPLDNPFFVVICASIHAPAPVYPSFPQSYGNNRKVITEKGQSEWHYVVHNIKCHSGLTPVLAKMKLRMGLAMVVMLSMALGRIKEKQKENMRSLVKQAA
jgi:hypothetical protein